MLTFRLLPLLAVILLVSPSARAEERSPKPEEKNLNEPVRVPFVECKRVCDPPLGSLKAADPKIWSTICEIKCVPNLKK
jgi:hypothetical protein